jgi:hypothetical protein
MLGLKFDRTAARSAPKTDPGRQVADRLADGYVPVAYHLPTGQDTFAWYRGPFAPQPVAPVTARPFPSSSAALIYDQATGTFDVSLATAWEIGRAITLADRGFAAKLVQFRRDAHRLVDRVLTALQSRHVNTTDADLETITQSGLIARHFLERLQADLAARVAALSTGNTPVGAAGHAAASELPDDPVAAVKELLDNDDVRALVAEELEPIGEWLESLTLLNQVPFAYLVAHPQLLPVESARFFAVDQNWIGALVDGALSVGVQTARDTWFQAVVHTIIPDAARIVAQHDHADSAQSSGLLMRSALVAGWPGLTVQASAAGKPLEPLRSDRLAPSVLLCLFAGVPDTVSVRAPHQGLHFSVSDGVVQPRQRSAPVGKPTGDPITIADEPDAMPDGSLRILNRQDLQNALQAIGQAKDPAAAKRHILKRARALGATDLLPEDWRVERVLDIASLAAKLGTKPDAGADFALQMLYAPEEVVFTR